MVIALTGAAFVVGTVTLACAVYFGTRLLAARFIAPDSRELAGSVVFRVSALHGLVLALVFAQELLSYQQIRAALLTEATAVANIYNDIRRYGGPDRSGVQQALTDYVRTVLDHEWQALEGEEPLPSQGWALRERIYLAVLDLVPETPREEALRRHMLQDVQEIATVRQMRENMSDLPVDPLFWFAALSGVVLVAMPFFVFQPSVINVMLLSLYGAFTGIVLFIIYALSDPFSPPGLLKPSALERLMRTEIGAAPQPE